MNKIVPARGCIANANVEKCNTASAPHLHPMHLSLIGMEQMMGSHHGHHTHVDHCESNPYPVSIPKPTE